MVVVVKPNPTPSVLFPIKEVDAVLVPKPPNGWVGARDGTAARPVNEDCAVFWGAAVVCATPNDAPNDGKLLKKNWTQKKLPMIRINEKNYKLTMTHGFC